ncbi:LBF_2804 family protein [Spirosoma pulveris]
MSTRPPNDSLGPLDHLALRYLRQSLDTPHPADEPYVLNPVESRVIRRTKIVTLTMASFLGVMGVLLLYGPQYMWPYLFTNTTFRLFGNVFALPLVTIFYGLLLVYLEVYLLVALNLRGVKMIMHVCQFPNAHDAQYERHLQALAKAALEKTNRGVLRLGISPYLNMPRWGLTLFFLINTAKAALSSVALKFFIKRFFGQYALRQVTELAGMPIYAFWNAWASWHVLHEAQVRVMAPTTIREFVHELHEEWGKNDEFSPLILEALQYVSILKRQYNYAHFLLTETLIDRFALQADMPISDNFLEKLAKAPASVQRSLERLLVFGVLVDGKLSYLEKRRLGELRKHGFLTYSVVEIKRIGDDYNMGRGLWV